MMMMHQAACLIYWEPTNLYTMPNKGLLLTIIIICTMHRSTFLFLSRLDSMEHTQDIFIIMISAMTDHVGRWNPDS